MDIVDVKVATFEHRDGVMKIVEDVYVKAEPLESAANVPFEMKRAGWQKIVDEAIEAGHSRVAVNKAGLVVGVRISKIVDENGIFNSIAIGDKVRKELLTKFRKGGGQAFEKVSSQESGVKILYFALSCVHPSYAGRGIAREMCIENMALGRRLGCAFCVVIASNWISQRIFDKLKFRELADMKYAEMKLEDGSPRYPNLDPKQKSVKLFVKKLE